MFDRIPNMSLLSVTVMQVSGLILQGLENFNKVKQVAKNNFIFEGEHLSTYIFSYNFATIMSLPEAVILFALAERTQQFESVRKKLRFLMFPLEIRKSHIFKEVHYKEVHK